jgi:hypothetical protein
VDRADLFVWLASPASVRPGSYALTELSFAEAKWRNPSGHVLPVLTGEMNAGDLPAYLRPINALTVRGNLEAEVVGWVQDRAQGSGGVPGYLGPAESLERFARFAQPPIRRARRALPRSSLGAFIFALVMLLAFTPFVYLSGMGPVAIAPAALGVLVLLYGVTRALRSIFARAKPIAAIVLDRVTGESGVTVHIQTTEGKRLKLEPVSKAARNTYVGDLGWAFVSGRMLLDFAPASSEVKS